MHVEMPQFIRYSNQIHIRATQITRNNAQRWLISEADKRTATTRLRIHLGCTYLPNPTEASYG